MVRAIGMRAATRAFIGVSYGMCRILATAVLVALLAAFVTVPVTPDTAPCLAALPTPLAAPAATPPTPDDLPPACVGGVVDAAPGTPPVGAPAPAAPPPVTAISASGPLSCEYPAGVSKTASGTVAATMLASSHVVVVVVRFPLASVMSVTTTVLMGTPAGSFACAAAICAAYCGPRFTGSCVGDPPLGTNGLTKPAAPCANQ